MKSSNMGIRPGLSIITVVLMNIWLLAPIEFCFADKSVFVRYVIDGDTIVLKKGTKVRYRGINTPETPHKDTPGEPLGWEATRRNGQLVRGRTVRLVQDDEK
ncbi:MAG: hypothetical protein KAV69_08215, partial [Deltaproteobacteria bacterium]|nr:hypothetical protein [Deltaproteobacteria bacterium]